MTSQPPDTVPIWPGLMKRKAPKLDLNLPKPTPGDPQPPAQADIFDITGQTDIEDLL